MLTPALILYQTNQAINPIDPLRILTSAVTPVVMVSATAILISVVNARYSAISDRVRSLAHEYRQDNISQKRRRIIREQVLIFNARIRLVSWAVRLLFLSAGTFISVAIMIAFSLWRHWFEMATPIAFFVGLLLVVIAILLTFLELNESNRTIHLEAEDVVRGDPPPA
jgi:hypothetical protein